MDMRVLNRVKSMMVDKLGSVVTEKVDISKFNEVFLFLDSYNRFDKIMPYGLFDGRARLESIQNTSEGVIFSHWVTLKTENIEKDFNKSRKLVRVLKDVVGVNRESLIFNLAINDIFVITLTSFFVDLNKGLPYFNLSICTEAEFKKILILLRQYLACILVIDLISDVDELEQVLHVFLNEPNSKLIDIVLELGVNNIK